MNETQIQRETRQVVEDVLEKTNLKSEVRVRTIRKMLLESLENE